MITASPASKVLPLGCLVIVFMASLTLFLIRDQRYIDHLPGLVEAHRNISSIIVQVLSTVLAIAQMYVVVALINFAARINLFQHSTSIDNLSFWAALSMPRFDRNLRQSRLLFVLLVLTLGPALGALWSGSLTPLSSKASRSDGVLLTPFFNAPIFRTMYPIPETGQLLVQCNDEGHEAPPDPRGLQYPTLDNCIVMGKLGSLMMAASTATNVTNPYQHPKLDNSTWTYKGRSYGKGSSTGLFNVTNTSISVKDQGYSYQESGYLATASCHQQSSNIFPFQQYYPAFTDTDSDVGQFTLWTADTIVLDSGNIPVPPFDVATPAWNELNSHPFGYFLWTAVQNDGVNILVTAGSNWSVSLANISCTIDFVPTLFATNVSTVDQSITVTPLEPAQNFTQTGNIVQAIMWDLDLISRMSSSSAAYSTMSNAVGDSVAAVQLVHTEMTRKEASELGLQNSIEALADDLLTYQGILAVARYDGESSETSVRRHFAAIKIGQTKFHIAQLVINIVLCVAYIFEAIRTRGWKKLPQFDFVDIKALILAALGPDHLSGDEKLDAFYGKDLTPKISYAGAMIPLRHHSSSGDIGQSSSTDLDFTHHLDDPTVSRRPEPTPGQHDSRATSYTSIMPLLGEPQRSHMIF